MIIFDPSGRACDQHLKGTMMILFYVGPLFPISLYVLDHFFRFSLLLLFPNIFQQKALKGQTQCSSSKIYEKKFQWILFGAEIFRGTEIVGGHDEARMNQPS